MAIWEKVKVINSLIRTLVLAAAVGLAGFLGWTGYRSFHARTIALEQKEAQLAEARQALEQNEKQLREQADKIESLDAEVAAKQARIEQLSTALALLKVDHRLAKIRVLRQEIDPASKRPVTQIEFVELDDQGQPIDAPREFTLQGDLVYVDYWVVKFDDQYIESAELDRSTSICLFRRIFGEYQQPRDGFVLDRVGSRPAVYARGGQMSEFEQKIWSDFWNISNDPRKAQQLGIRAAHGEAVSAKLRPGKTYRLLLRASGGLTITPAEDSPSAAPAT